MPGVLYGVDVIPVLDPAISSFEVIQNQVGKAVLGVHQSTANPVVNVELSWKPVQLLVGKAVVHFFLQVSIPTFKGSNLVTSCMAWTLSSPKGPYLSYLLRLARSYGVLLANLPILMHKTLPNHWVSWLLASVQSLPSLSLLPVFPHLWHPSQFLESA